MKEKVLSLLKTSYAKYGFKKDELEGLAELIAKNLADDATDEDVTTAVNDAEAWASMTQKIATRTATEVEKKYNKPEPKPEPKVDPKPEEKKEKPSELEKLVRNLQTQIEEMHTAQKAERLSARLSNDPRLSAVPTAFVNMYQLQSEDELDALVSKIESDFSTIKSQMLKNGIVAQLPTKGSELGQETPTEEELRNLAKSMF